MSFTNNPGTYSFSKINLFRVDFFSDQISAVGPIRSTCNFIFIKISGLTIWFYNFQFIAILIFFGPNLSPKGLILHKKTSYEIVYENQELIEIF